jgi:hypothetical protein
LMSLLLISAIVRPFAQEIIGKAREVYGLAGRSQEEVLIATLNYKTSSSE